MDKTRRRRILSFKKRRKLPWGVPFLVSTLIRVLRRTYRFKITDPGDFLGTRQPWPVVFILWHNRIIFVPDCFPARVRLHCAALVSGSRDGEYAASLIRCFGLQTVRGSSSRGGSRALLELKSILEQDTSVVFALDGPRGPRYEAQPGPAFLSRTARRPIVPVSLNAPRRWELPGWDRTQIPKPFSKVELLIGAPIEPPDGDETQDRAEMCRALCDTLMDMTDDTKA